MPNLNNLHKLSAAGILITLGIIYGDIGTSPIYVMRAITDEHELSKELIFGGMSAVFWTLMIIVSTPFLGQVKLECNSFDFYFQLK